MNKILIVDDDPDFVKSLKTTFEAKCYRVITTVSATDV